MKPEEKWRWDHDMTGGISSVETDDEFDDAEESNKQGHFLHQIANGYDWMREEERIGRWIGLLLAVFVWGAALIVFYLATVLPNNAIRMPDGTIIYTHTENLHNVK